VCRGVVVGEGGVGGGGGASEFVCAQEIGRQREQHSVMFIDDPFV